MLDPRFLPDVVDREADVMGHAGGFDDGLAGGIVAVALLEHVGHRQDGLERIALSAARWADVSFTRRNPDAVVEDALDRLRRNAGTVVLDDDRPAIDCDRDGRGDLGFFLERRDRADDRVEHL